jgi:hypothetical protein
LENLDQATAAWQIFISYYKEQTMGCIFSKNSNILSKTIEYHDIETGIYKDLDDDAIDLKEENLHHRNIPKQVAYVIYV